MGFNTLLYITTLIVSLTLSSAAPGISGLFSIFGGINGNNQGLYGGALGYGNSIGPYGVGGTGGALGYSPYGGYPPYAGYPSSGPYGGAYNPYYGYTYPRPVYG